MLNDKKERFTFNIIVKELKKFSSIEIMIIIMMENTKKYKKKVMVKMKTIIKLFYFLLLMELINLQMEYMKQSH